MFSDFLFPYYNVGVVKTSKFPSILTLADKIPVFKKGDKECKKITDQLVSHLIYQRFLK